MTTTTTHTLICPDWCRHDEFGHGPYFVGAELRCDHPGPDFGRNIHVGGEQRGDRLIVTADVCDTEGSVYTAAELRQLATAALAAAEWLEAHA